MLVLRYMRKQNRNTINIQISQTPKKLEVSISKFDFTDTTKFKNTYTEIEPDDEFIEILDRLNAYIGEKELA